MKDRIKQFIEFKNITAGELSVILDVQRSNISHILNGRNKPGAAFIEKLLIKFPDLNARWLLTGVGDMTERGAQNKSEIPRNIFTSNEDTFVSTTPDKVKDVLPINKTAGTSEDLEKILLIYKDGTFSQLIPRENT